MALIKFKALREGVRMPVYMTAGAAAMDFYSLTDVSVVPGTVTFVPLGLAMELPPDKAMLLSARSSHGLKYGAGVPQGFGLIDSDYRNELAMLFTCIKPFDICKGERLCQGLVIEAPQHHLALVSELSPTDRRGGFGSTNHQSGENHG